MMDALQQLWVGRQKHSLNEDYCYRCIYPDNKQFGLNCFYGNDRSFSCGYIFDNSDFIIEFTVSDWRGIDSIDHHQGCCRGRLQRDNVSIVALYYQTSPWEYSKKDFRTHLEKLWQELPAGTLLYQYKSYVEREVIIKSLMRCGAM